MSELDAYEQAVLNEARKRVGPIREAMILTRRRIEYEFDVWLRTMDPNDPESVAILKRLRIFDANIKVWQDINKIHSVERQRALEFIKTIKNSRE